MILDEITAWKRRHELPHLPPVDRAALRDLPPTRGLASALRRASGRPINVLAEAKKGSPSKGLIAPDYDPVRAAFFYRHGGAAAMSVLTDEHFFLGHLDHLIAVRAASDLPLLRKDFTLDERQIAQARLAGADAILLIAACLEDGQIRDLDGFAREIGLDVLLEVHDADEAARAVRLGAPLVGVNNRDLQTFRVDLQTTFDLLPGLRDGRRIVISESGISSRDECRRLEEAGVDAVLVGETLMREADPAAGIRRLRGELATC